MELFWSYSHLALVFLVSYVFWLSQQVGVQTEVEPDAGANALEDRVNAVLPLQNKDEDKEGEE